jgi:hypothetical protein
MPTMRLSSSGLIWQLLKAGVMIEGVIKETEIGSPQGVKYLGFVIRTNYVFIDKEREGGMKFMMLTNLKAVFPFPIHLS